MQTWKNGFPSSSVLNYYSYQGKLWIKKYGNTCTVSNLEIASHTVLNLSKLMKKTTPEPNLNFTERKSIFCDF